METQNVRRDIEYKGFDGTWRMSITFDGEVTVTKDNKSRIYDIPERITRIEHDTEYVFLYVEGRKFYQFKFEVNNFLVGDIFTNEGEFLEAFACYDFEEN
jgi:hypothetical protein